MSVTISKALARKLKPGWEEKILSHGDVQSETGVFLVDVNSIHEILGCGQEIQFLCRSGSSEKFMKSLRQDTPCETHGVPGCRQEGCQIWLARP